MGTTKEKDFSLFWFCNFLYILLYMYMDFQGLLEFAFRDLGFGARGHRLLPDYAGPQMPEM